MYTHNSQTSAYAAISRSGKRKPISKIASLRKQLEKLEAMTF